MKTYLKVSELNQEQRGHLAWRLDHKTFCGYVTAIHIAKGHHEKDYELNEVFQLFGMTPHQAKIHARKVINFKLITSDKQ